MTILFQNAMVFDGTGAPAYHSNIIVDGEKIIAITDNANLEKEVDTVIDLKGLALCPGFIDTHSHSDLVLFDRPQLSAKIEQGITTEILGQDGVSMAPLPLEYKDDWRNNIAGLEGRSDAIDWEFKDTEGYFNLIEQSDVATNVCYLAPHGNIRMEAMGLGEEVASAENIKKMQEILQRELDAGANGLSTGLIYPPCTYANMEELSALCTIAAKNNVPLVIHQRSEADAILESMAEIIDIGKETGVHVHFSHFKICGKYNTDKFEPVLALLDQAEANGVKVTFDQYPYIAGSTTLSAIIPPWAHAGGTKKLLERLADPATRKKIIADINDLPSDWDNFIAFAGTDGISITNANLAKNQDAIGKTLDELAELRNTDPINAALDIILEEENGVSMVDFYGLEEHVKGFMARKEMNLCTDGLMHGTPHPRTYGAFPRFLGSYCRDQKLMPLEEGIRKATLQAATTFAIKDRGVIAPNYFADIVIFNPETICDTNSFTDPCKKPDGIMMVMVNGEVAYKDDDFVCELNKKINFAGKVCRS